MSLSKMWKRFCVVWPLVVLASISSKAQQASNAKDCLPVLAKDYYSYAQQNNLQEDFLRSIDSESWEELRRSNSANATGLFSAGLFSFSDDYNALDSKRTKYLDSIHYSRNQQQALNILQITTAPRAYPAYEACLRSLSTGLAVWASRETLDQIELHVRYANPPGVKSMALEGLVSGGSVANTVAGHLWADGSKWGVNQEKVFTITAARGVPETNIIVAPSDGSSPISLTFRRADALLTLSYVGTTDVLRLKDRRGMAHTPNNNENRGGCPNEVGHHDGKYCTSRTTVNLSTTAPHFLQNARPGCNGEGCPWTSSGPPSISADGLTATFYLDNWGHDVDAILTADEYERLTATKCGGDGPIPVVKNQPVLFTASKECLSIATLKWTMLPDRAEGSFRFGDRASPDGKIVMDSTLDNATVLLVSYKLAK